MATTYQPYKGTSKSRLLVMANDDNGTNHKDPEDVQFENVRQNTGPGGRNTAITAIPTDTSKQSQVLRYTRLPLSVLYDLGREQLRPVKIESVPFKIHDILDEINDALGLDLLPEEVTNNEYTELKGIYTLRIAGATSSIAWTSSSYDFIADFELPGQRYDEYGWPRIDEDGYLRLDNNDEDDTDPGDGDEQKGEYLGKATFVLDESKPPEDMGVSTLYFLKATDVEGDLPANLIGARSYVSSTSPLPAMETIQIATEDDTVLDLYGEIVGGSVLDLDSAGPGTLAVSVMGVLDESSKDTPLTVEFYRRVGREVVQEVSVRTTDVTSFIAVPGSLGEVSKMVGYAMGNAQCGMVDSTGTRLDGLVSASSSLSSFSVTSYSATLTEINGDKYAILAVSFSGTSEPASQKSVLINGRAFTFTHNAYPMINETVVLEQNPELYAFIESTFENPIVTFKEP